MTESPTQTAHQIQAQITLAKTHLTQRDHILNQLETLDGRRHTLIQQVNTLEQQAINAKNELDNIRGRVLPILGGWLSGEGTPQQQLQIAHQLQTKQLADLTQERQALTQRLWAQALT